MDYRIIYSERKTICIQITPKGEIIIRSPENLARDTIYEFVSKHRNWIEKRLERLKSTAPSILDLSDEQIAELKRLAKETIPNRVEYFSAVMGVYPEHVSINSAKTRFGSCSSKNRLNFSCRLMQYSNKALDYVIVHELAHIKHHNHSKDFWKYVEQFIPDYKERKKLLK